MRQASISVGETDQSCAPEGACTWRIGAQEAPPIASQLSHRSRVFRDDPADSWAIGWRLLLEAIGWVSLCFIAGTGLFHLFS